MPCIFQTAVAALAVAQVAMAHTWIEQLRNIDDKGAYVGNYGYPRGMVSKTDPGFNGFSMNIELPAYQDGKLFIDDTTPLCHANQRKQVQSQDKYPRLKTAPGGFVAMRYSENGHVTKPNNQQGKPKHGGTVFIYGTTEPKEDERLANVLQWNTEGKGGDARGVLLAMNNFDDGRCYEKNETPESQQRQKADPNFALGQVSDGPGNYPLMCETNVQLPKTATVGKPYTFYWVWQWNTAPGIDPGLPKGKDEYYTTCIDVDVASENTAMAAEANKKDGLGSQQDAMSAAVADWASRTAAMTNAIEGEVGPYFKAQPTPSGPGAAPSQNPNAPPASNKPPSQTPSAPPAPAPPASAPTASGQPPQQTGIPTLTMTKSRKPKPTQQPTQQPGGGNGTAVTVTGTVFLTVTGKPSAKVPPAAPTPANPNVPSGAVPLPSSKAAAPPAAITSSPSRAPPAAATSQAGAPQPSGGTGSVMNNPNGAKFRRMHA